MKDFIPSLKLLSDYNNLNKTILVLKRTDSLIDAKKFINDEGMSFIFEFEKNSNNKIVNLQKNFDKKNLQLLVEYLSNVKIVTLRVASLPSLNFVNKIYNYAFQDLQTKFVLDFCEHPEILGGVLIECSGKTYDESLLKNINTYYEFI